MDRIRRRSIGRQALCLAGVPALLASAVLGVAAPGAGRAEAEEAPTSYEAVASAEGVRFSFAVPGFAAVDTVLDGGGPVASSVIDGLGNSRAFASLPYPGDLAITGPGLLAGVTGLPAPPSYPFYVDSSYPTKVEAKFAQPGYELVAKSSELLSEATAATGGGSEQAGLGVTRTSAVSQRDAASGVVTAEATGNTDLVSVGPLRLAHVVSRAKVTRAPGAEPTRDSTFSIAGATVNGQAVGISEKGLTVAGQSTPLPADNPLLKALEQAKIKVSALAATSEPDGVVSPGLVIDQQQQIPGGPNLVFRYVFGRMSARAVVSGDPTGASSELPLVTGPVESSDTSEVGDAPVSSSLTEPALVEETSASASTDAADTDIGYGSRGSSAGGASEIAEAGDSGTGGSASGGQEVAAAPGGNPAAAAPIAASGPSMESVYLITALGAIAALAGGFLIRLLGVKLAWTS